MTIAVNTFRVSGCTGCNAESLINGVLASLMSVQLTIDRMGPFCDERKGFIILIT